MYHHSYLKASLDRGFFDVYKTQKPIQIKLIAYRKSNYLHKYSYLRKKKIIFFSKMFFCINIYTTFVGLNN